MPAAFLSAGLGYLGAQAQADATESAANTSANAQLEAARLAAEAARFRPVGITTRFGKSTFEMSPEGYLTGAGYELDPRIKASQDRLSLLAGGALGQAEMAQQQYAPLSQAASGLFGLGQQYLAQSPEQVAAQYIKQQQDLLAPSRERQMAQLQNQLFQQGRGGLSVGATGMRPSGAMGLGASTPEMEAYYNAMAQQDAQLAAQAQEAGQRNVAFGAGLFGTGANMLGQYQAGQVGALSPFTTYLGAGQAIEGLGQETLRIGSELGGKASTAGSRVGEYLFTGGQNAALARQRANEQSPLGDFLASSGNQRKLQSGFERLFGGGIGGAGGSGLSQYEMDALSRDAFNQSAYAGGIY